jgi:hypothetical protein
MSNNLHLANNKYKILIDYRFYNDNDQYKEILKNQNLKNYSFIRQKLCEIDKFKLPQKYISISAWTHDNPKAKRSGVPYINHINEGLLIAKNLKINCETTLSAYVLHPIVQNDNDVVKGMNFLIDNIDQYEIFLIMEYTISD